MISPDCGIHRRGMQLKHHLTMRRIVHTFWATGFVRSALNSSTTSSVMFMVGNVLLMILLLGYSSTGNTTSHSRPWMTCGWVGVRKE